MASLNSRALATYFTDSQASAFYRVGNHHGGAGAFVQPIGAVEKTQARIRLGLILMNTRPVLSFTI